MKKTEKPGNQNSFPVRRTNLPFFLHNYCFTKFIGKGGFAEVYLVNHVDQNGFERQYVAKVVTVEEPDTQESWCVFDAEVNSLSLLDHPHIVRLYDHFREGCQFYMILELCSGGSLHDEIQRTNGLSIHRFITVAKEICEALVYCHNKGIAHRDIKPGNVLLDEFGRTRLADFGLSLRMTNGNLYLPFGGSLIYTAPEIFQKKQHDPKAADVWAFGVMLVVMATGSSPWRCDSLGELKQQAEKGIIVFKKPIPDIIKDLVCKCIVVDPQNRLTMQQVLEHPIFQNFRPQRVCASRSQKYTVSNKLQWSKINRNNADETNCEEAFNNGMNQFESNGNLYISMDGRRGSGSFGKRTPIHTASSYFHHPLVKKNVRQRIKKVAPTVFETFSNHDDVTEV